MKLEGMGSWGTGNYKNPGRESRLMKSFSSGNRRIPPLLAAVFAFCLVFLVGSVIALSFGKTQATQKVEKPVVPVVKVQPVVENETIVVPQKRIEPGQMIEASMLTAITVPRSAVPLGAIRSFEEIESMYSTADIAPNQPIVREYLSKDKPMNPVSVILPQGYRAVTITTNATAGVEGWARAGTRVDIQFIVAQKGVPTIRTIVQNAKIVSADRQLKQNPEPNAPVPSTVTLQVTEEDAQKITLTSAVGTLLMHMRGTSDNEISNIGSSPLMLTDLYDLDTSDSGPQGRIKMKKKDGSYEEWAVVRGNVLKK